MSYRIVHETPTPAQWMQLRQSVGWATFDDNAARESLRNTLFCVCAYDEQDTLVGMGRVLGDGVFCFYIGNVMVRPDRQGAGIGGDIMRHILAYVETRAQPGAIASLLSIQGKEDFYARFGFQKRPDDRHGSGMSRYY